MMADVTGLPGFLKHDGAKGSTLKKKMPYNDSASYQKSNDLLGSMKESPPHFYKIYEYTTLYYCVSCCADT